VGTGGHVVVIFDGECNVCNGWADFLLRFDKRDIFRFAALQSEVGARLANGVEGSIVLVDGSAVLVRSDAVLRMLALLGFPFSLAGIARVIPRGLRDAVYDFVARNRIKWFGRRDTCRVPTADERGKFL
jgi:predicted DCC family thiol-disulfide oxidoreductase YuxK